MRLRQALVPVLLVAVATLSSCGRGDSSGGSADHHPGTPSTRSAVSTQSTAPGSGGSDACGLLTTDEVAAAVGTPGKAGVASSGPSAAGGSFTSCLWMSDDPDHPADQATVTIYPNAAAADSARESDSQDVAGLGDKAFTGSYSSIWTYVGKRSFFAQWYTFADSGSDNLAQSRALAQAVIGAL